MLFLAKATLTVTPFNTNVQISTVRIRSKLEYRCGVYSTTMMSSLKKHHIIRLALLFTLREGHKSETNPASI